VSRASELPYDALVEPREESPLALGSVAVPPAGSAALGRAGSDCLLFVGDGSGSLALGEELHELAPGAAALVPADETATVSSPGGMSLLLASIGPAAERHAPLGEPAATARETAASSRATGTRSFQVLFGPDNGCARATLFLGYVQPGRAPWHYHLYDEIVFVRSGHARVHRSDGRIDEAPAGTAFRLSPREIHIVENAGSSELVVLGLFTPAGSPSAAYLPLEEPSARP
jgi:mannose-6-phosphate isomerase-like protein (cupin superfamily)